MSIKERINNDIKDAMRARNKKKLGALRLISAAFKQIEVDERITIHDERALSILDKLVKQRKESITQFSQAGRDDLVQKEQFELDVIQAYLPKPLSDQEIEKLIVKAIAETNAEKMADMGKVMARLKPEIQGRCDMSQVSTIVKNKLS